MQVGERAGLEVGTGEHGHGGPFSGGRAASGGVGSAAGDHAPGAGAPRQPSGRAPAVGPEHGYRCARGRLSLTRNETVREPSVAVAVSVSDERLPSLRRPAALSLTLTLLVLPARMENRVLP